MAKPQYNPSVPPTVPTVGKQYPVPADPWRDTCADDGRIGDGSKQLREQYLMYPNHRAISVDEERERGGFTRNTAPVGLGDAPEQSWLPGNAGDEPETESQPY